MKHGVVLLHGLYMNSLTMKGMENFLKNQNYQVLNIDYASSKHDLAKLAEIIHPSIKQFSQIVDNINLVCFSMGGLVARAYLKLYLPHNLHRIVMIGTPNHGSPVADLLHQQWFYKKLFGPAGQQLITDQSSLKNILSIPDCEIGIISGKTNFSPFGNILEKPHDGLVTVASTTLNNMKDHIIIDGWHIPLQFKKEVYQLTFNFLKEGRF